MQKPFQSITVLLLLAAASMASLASELITVYKSPTCGCCSAWIKHLEHNDFKVEAHNSNRMDQVKMALGVAPQHASCHTAEIDGYVIEGHVPAAEIRRLLRERPTMAGLSVPGMPMGSPGMEGPRTEPYQVLLFDRQGGDRVFAEY